MSTGSLPAIQIKQHIRVSDTLKNQLIYFVLMKEWKIKKAAIYLCINYATAKYIVNRYRKTKIMKKIYLQCERRCSFKPKEPMSNTVKLICSKGGIQQE